MFTGSDLHADIPCTPDDGAQVADGNAVAHAVDLLVVLAADRSRDEADAVDHVVARDEGALAGLDVLDGAAGVRDLGATAPARPLKLTPTPMPPWISGRLRFHPSKRFIEKIFFIAFSSIIYSFYYYI